MQARIAIRTSNSNVVPHRFCSDVHGRACVHGRCSRHAQHKTMHALPWCACMSADGGSASRGGAEARARALLAWALVGVRTADWYGHTQTGSTGAKSGNSVGQECGTAVWDKSVGQKCRTKVWDESVGQKCGTKVSDSTQKTSVTDVSEAPGRGFTTRGSGAHGARPPPEVRPNREAPGTPERLPGTVPTT